MSPNPVLSRHGASGEERGGEMVTDGGYRVLRAVLRPLVPSDRIEESRTWTNPVAATPENIEKGKALFHGKAFCVTCHGKDGKGPGGDIEPGILKGPLPRDFTDRDRQAARTDGELF